MSDDTHTLDKVFWFEPTSTNHLDDLRSSIWFYRIGTNEDTLIALVSGPDDYVACARARAICKALNDDVRRNLALASKEDGE